MSVEQAVARVQDAKLLFGARDGNVGKAAFFFHLALPLGDGLHTGEESFLHTRQKDNGELKTFCTVHRHHHNGISGLIVAVNVGNKSRLLQKSGERGLVVVLHIFENARLELVEVFQTFRLLRSCRHKHLAVACFFKHDVKKRIQGGAPCKTGEIVDDRRKVQKRCGTVLKGNKGVGALKHRKLTALLLGGNQRHRFKRFGTDLAARLVDNACEARVVIVIADELQICHNVADLFAVGKARSAKNTVRNRRASKRLFNALRLCVRAVQDGKIAVGRLFFGNRTGDGIHQVASLHVLIVTKLEADLSTRARGRPKGFALASAVVGDHRVCRIQNVTRRAVILFELDGFCIGKDLIKGEDVFNGRTAEAVNALVIVANDHQVFGGGVGQEDRQLHLRHVGILKLVHTHIAEATLICLANFGIAAQEKNGLHNDVVKVKRIGLAQIALVFLINARDLLLAVILSCFEQESIGREELILCVADGIDNGFDRQQLFVNVEPLHGGKHRFFGVVGVIDGKAGAVAHALAVLAQNAHADGVEGACPNVGGGVLLFGEHPRQSLLDLVCRLVGKGDGKHAIGLTGIVGKLRQNVLTNCLGLQHHCALQLGNARFIRSVRDVVAEIGIAVADDKSDTAHKHSGLAAARTCKDEERIVYGEHRLALTFIQFTKCFVKQSALDRKIALFDKGLHEVPFLIEVYNRCDQPHRKANKENGGKQTFQECGRQAPQGERRGITGRNVLFCVDVVDLSRLSCGECRKKQKENHNAKDEDLVAACVDVERRKIGLTEQTENVIADMQKDRCEEGTRGVHCRGKKRTQYQIGKEMRKGEMQHGKQKRACHNRHTCAAFFILRAKNGAIGQFLANGR